MAELPARPDLDQLRRRAKQLLAAARAGDPAALERLHAVSGRVILASAQLAVAREHGFASWERLRTEVTRRVILDGGDVRGLLRLLADEPALATDVMQHWHDHPLGAAPLNYVAMLRYDTAAHVWRDVEGTAAMARALLAAGAPVDGLPGERETPLITAASYGDAEVARVLVEAGAALEATAAPDAGGVPGGTAALHAAVFGMTGVLDVLVEAGADVSDVVLGAAAGTVPGGQLAAATDEQRVLALIMAAHHERLEVIERLVAAGTPVDAVDPHWGRQPLRVAAADGRAASVRRLLALGADPALRDAEGRTALELARSGQVSCPGNPGFAEVFDLLT